MLHLSRWKVILVVAATLFGLIFSLPNMLTPQQRDALPDWVPKQTLNLGLDLQGGSYLLYEVDTAAMKRERLVNMVEDVRTNLRAKQIAFADLGLVGEQVRVRIVDPAQVESAFQELQKTMPRLPDGSPEFSFGRNGDVLTLTMTDQALAVGSVQAVKQSIEIIRRRTDPDGNKELSITQQGADRIVVQAPGESDPEKLKRIIGQTAKLTFQMVDDTVSVEEAKAGRTPPGSVLMKSVDGYENEIVLKRRALVSGEMLKDASFGYDQQTNRPVVNFRFDGRGAAAFARATSQGVGKRFAIVLDNQVISAPVINEPITGGQGQISGNFNEESANELALLLRSGALPAPLNVQEQRAVTAELGADAVEAGRVSTLIAAIAILLFIVLAYGLFGWFAAGALTVNGLLIVAIMSVTQATLTLPGIAGLILTLAVAVDANVLIYERMRDEARAGRSAISAADAGYTRAMSTIIDANLTSLIAAAIMFGFGSGPVKGFAWTLSIGVFTSVFTAVLITQVLIALWFRWAKPKTLPIA